MGHGDPRPLKEQTGFEIASVSKVFTALLFADMLQKGDVGLGDTVTRYLPAGITLPGRNGRSMTLADLATHTAGLPFMPDHLPEMDDPSARYTDSMVYDFLSRWVIRGDIGTTWEYSNVDYWLLGKALAARGGMEFEQLLQTRVFAPLKLNGTGIRLTPVQNASMAVGHNAVIQPAPRFADVPGYNLMSAAGGVSSTAADLLTFLGEVMGFEPSPLTKSMEWMLSVRRPAGGLEQALGWMVMGKGDDEIVFHDGGSFGYASALAWDPKARIGVVVLSNQVADVGDIARHLLRPDMPLGKPSAVKRTEIVVDAALLDSYVGTYAVEGEGDFIISRPGRLLAFEAPSDWGLPRLRLHAETRTEFFASELPLHVAFQPDAGGKVTGLLIYPPRGQKPMLAARKSPGH